MIRTSLAAFLRDEEASAAMEYLLIVGLLGVFWIAAGRGYASEVTKLFNALSKDLRSIKIG